MSLFAERLHTDYIVVDPTRTPHGHDLGAADIARMDRKRGFTGIACHFIVRLDGSVEEGRPVATVGACSPDLDATSVYIRYVGGISASGKHRNTMTPAQRSAVEQLVAQLQTRYPAAERLD